MDKFWNWRGWTAVNSICQILIVVLAFIAIIITLKQIGNRKAMLKSFYYSSFKNRNQNWLQFKKATVFGCFFVWRLGANKIGYFRNFLLQK